MPVINRKPRLEFYWSPVTRETLSAGGIRMMQVVDHEVRWRVVAGNGEIVLPGEGHGDRTDARRAVERASQILAGVDAGTTRVMTLGPKPKLPGAQP